MASKNTIKIYEANAYYHLYNRGVGKMEIFKEEEDYVVFLHYLRIIFSPLEVLRQEFLQISTTESSGSKHIKSLTHALNQAARLKIFQNVELLSFCLMPNHFHLLVYQKVKNGIELLMRRLATGYSSYYAKKYNHVGPVFCRPYKASHLHYDPELQALAVTHYIEHNPLAINLPKKPSWEAQNNEQFYPFSSLRYYSSLDNNLKMQPPVWLKTEHLRNIFLKIKSKPNGLFEEMVAKHQGLTDFIISDAKFDLEEIRLQHLAIL